MIDTAIILVGGEGTRLRPLTEETPKPLLPLKGKAIVHHAVQNLQKHGIKRIILAVGYKAETIKNYFSDKTTEGIDLSYVEEKVPLGTGGALREASKDFWKPFLALNGDNLADFDFTTMMQQHLSNKAKITLALYPVEDVTQYGIAQLQGNSIVRFIEKPRREEAPSNLNNAGAYIIEPGVLQRILPEGRSSVERDCFEKLAVRGELGAFIHQGQWFPTDTLKKYQKACVEFEVAINWKEKKVIVADVDDTICTTNQQISLEMADQINQLIQKGYTFAFISGTKLEDLKEMISSRIIEEHHLLAGTGTKYAVVRERQHTLHYAHSLTTQEKKEIFEALDKLIEAFDIRTMTTKEDQVQDRDSQISFSGPGRHVSLDIKRAYDPDRTKRNKWLAFLEQHLNTTKFCITIGGTTTIDITQKGTNKEWGIKEFARINTLPLSSILFIGDKLYPGGNDYPAARIVDCVSVRSPEETRERLNWLLALQEKGEGKRR